MSLRRFGDGLRDILHTVSCLSPVQASKAQMTCTHSSDTKNLTFLHFQVLSLKQHFTLCPDWPNLEGVSKTKRTSFKRRPLSSPSMDVRI